MSNGLRVVYAGTPDFAVPALQALLDSPHHVVAVYTQPDRPAGRGRQLQFSPVKQLAVAAGIPVEQPENFKAVEAVEHLASYAADVMVVAAYGLLLPQVVLKTPRYGCLNIHGSLLPRWRGAAPIQRAIQAGDAETGVTIMQMAVGLDTGDMLYKVSLPIKADTGGQFTHDRLAEQGAAALLVTLDTLMDGGLAPEAQDDALACYAHKLSKSDAEIDWWRPAVEIDRMIRAFDAWPTAYTFYDGKPVRFFASTLADRGVSSAPPGTVVHESRVGLDIVAGDGQCVRVSMLQMPGGKRLSAADFLNARSLLGVCFAAAGGHS